MVTEESTKDTVKTIAQGMPADAVYPWLLTRVLFYAHAASGATRIRHSLRPLVSRVICFQQLGRIAPRERRFVSALFARPILPDARLRRAPQDEVMTCGAILDPRGEERGKAVRLEP